MEQKIEMVTFLKYKHERMNKTRRIEHCVSRTRSSSCALSATPFGIVFTVNVFEDNYQFLTDRPSEYVTHWFQSLNSFQNSGTQKVNRGHFFRTPTKQCHLHVYS